MIPFVGLTPDGEINAALRTPDGIRSVTVCPRTGAVIERPGEERYGDPLFRVLVRAARQFVY